MKTQKCHCCNGSGTELDSQDVGSVLRLRREKSGVSLRKLAKKMGISPSYMCDLEFGRRAWSDVLLKKYNKALK